MSCQLVKRFSSRHELAVCHAELTPTNPVQEFDCGQNRLRRSEGFELEHGLGNAFDSMMILLDDIVEILDFGDFDCDGTVRNWLVVHCLDDVIFVHNCRIRQL